MCVREWGVKNPLSPRNVLEQYSLLPSDRGAERLGSSRNTKIKEDNTEEQKRLQLENTSIDSSPESECLSKLTHQSSTHLTLATFYHFITSFRFSKKKHSKSNEKSLEFA